MKDPQTTARASSLRMKSEESRGEMETDEHLREILFIGGFFDELLHMSTHGEGNGIVLLPQATGGDGLLSVLVGLHDFVSMRVLDIVDSARRREVHQDGEITRG
jgi:hypothetical protein